jgi:hypothetical protein
MHTYVCIQKHTYCILQIDELKGQLAAIGPVEHTFCARQETEPSLAKEPIETTHIVTTLETDIRFSNEADVLCLKTPFIQGPSKISVEGPFSGEKQQRRLLQKGSENGSTRRDADAVFAGLPDRQTVLWEQERIEFTRREAEFTATVEALQGQIKVRVYACVCLSFFAHFVHMSCSANDRTRQRLNVCIFVYILNFNHLN